ncbi:MAG: acyl-CoA dehydrogenase family protein [Novosphingobium sp.]|nr:acyl-CoA dehydrogenase family protein [Novosphingobium sp.]
MHFAFSEDQLAITEAARDMLVDTCEGADLRKLLDSGEAMDAARWQTITEMGLVAMLAPEEAGGLGLGLVDLIGIAEAAGYVALPEPLVEQAGIAIPLLASLADNRGWLERAVGGEIVAIGHPANPFVANADSAGALLLDHDGQVHLVEREAVTLTRQESFDPFRRLFRVDWTPSAATLVTDSWGDTAERGALLAAAQLIGLGQRAINMAVDYAKDRTQFGKPIGTYQAVKHLCASAQVKVEFARPVVHAAAAEFATGGLPAQARLAHAKIAAGEAADLATRSAVQVHGAMGMTWEIDLHFHLKRAHALNYAWGTNGRHMETVIERIRTLPTGADMTFAAEVA